VGKINIEKYIGFLLDLDLFDGFADEQLMQLFSTEKYSINKYTKGQIIHLQDEVCLAMDIVLEGEVSVQKIDSAGNILKIVAFYGEEVIGANLLFSNRNTYPMTIVSESKSVILHIYKELVLELCHANILFMSRLMTIIADKTLVLTDKIDVISLKTISQRIIDYLRYQFYIQNSYTIRLSITKKELAQRLGIQRSSLSRELQKMRQKGLLEYDSKTITIKEHSIIQGDC
jgi:cAMP-binding proteins - catabolite gene activator and regulatory subunit of cAMP-dependent protein kinases